MSPAVAVTTIACGTLVKLALIIAGLRLLLAVAPRLSMGNPRQPAKNEPKNETGSAPAAQDDGRPVPPPPYVPTGSVTP